jgi:cell division protein FtsW
MKRYLAKMDLGLLTLTILYCILGTIMIYSASSILTVLSLKVPSTYFFVRQWIFLLVGFLFGLVLIRIPTSKYKIPSILLLVIIIFALAGLYLYGKIVNGAQGWYDLGFFNFQPSEFAKTIIIVNMACYYNTLINNKETNLAKYILPLAPIFIIIVLVAMQPDIGSAAIIAGLVLLIFFGLPMNKYVKNKCYKILGGALVIIAIFGLALGPTLLSKYQANRLNYKNPCTRYQENTGYQVCNGFIAIKNGGLFGLGFGNSTQKYLYLPEAHTDFIFPIICEELGSIVGAIIIIGYGIMLWRILFIAKHANNVRNSIIAYGTFIYLALHILVNLLGVLALIPLTGVPLPLLSYGGSFTLNALILLFLCQRVAIESHDAKLKEELVAIK